MLEIKIDSKGTGPLYHQIIAQVKSLIRRRKLKAGEQIPSVRDLAGWLQVNPSTVARAYYTLKQEGLVSTSRRRGTIIIGANEKFSKVQAPQLAEMPDGNQLPDVAITYTLHPAFWHIQRSS
jgi:GntR family transcriptional regulator